MGGATPRVVVQGIIRKQAERALGASLWSLPQALPAFPSWKIKANLFLSGCCWSTFYHSKEDGALGRSGAGIAFHIQAFRVPSRGLSPFTQYTLVSGGGAPQQAVNSGSLMTSQNLGPNYM